MAPPVRLYIDEPLEAGQTTIFSFLNGSLGIARLAPPPRLGPKPKTSGHADTVLGRRLIGGINERQTIELFANARLSQVDEAEPGGEDIVRGVILEKEEDDDAEYLLAHRYSYSRETKLAAVDYFQTTWRKNKDDTLERFSCRYASRRLKITRKMLRSWVANKDKILAQKKGSFRSRREYTPPKEPVMEAELYNEFEKARDQCRKISFKWILRYARAIYGRLHPKQVSQREGHKKTYFGFRFSSGQYNGFRGRYNISLHCGTKRAQKSLEGLLLVIQNWLQFNRRLMVVQEDSICGIPRGPEF
jgi:hypothetical protein